MTRLLFVPHPHTLLWLDLEGDPASLVDAILRGDWQPPAPYAALAGRLKAYWHEGLVIVSVLELNASAAPAPRQELARRQREVLKCLADGLTSRQTALRLGISERTVFHHIASLKKILGAGTRAELIHKAREQLR